MSVDPLSFLDQPQGNEPSTSGNDPLSFLDQGESSDLIKTAPPISAKQLGRNVGRAATTVGSTIAGIPGDITSFFGQGINQVAKWVGEGKSPEEMKEIVDNPFTSRNIRKGIEKFFPEMAPKNEQEKGWDDALSLISSLLVPLPGGASTKVIDPRTKTAIYRAGRLLGISEKEMTPLIQGEKKLGLLGGVAGKTNQMKETVQALHDKLGAGYDSLTFQASRLPAISQTGVNKLARTYKGTVNKWKNTLAADPDTQAAINYAEKALDTLRTSGTNPEALINFNKNVNKAVNWGAIRGGKKMLAALKEPARELLRSEHPYLAKQATNLDAMWGKMKRFSDAVGLKKINDFYHYDKDTKKLVKLAFKYGPLAGGAILGAGTMGVPGAVTGAAAVYGGGRLATQLLTNPKLQNLHSKMLNAIKNGSKKVAPKLILAWEKLTGQKSEDALKFLEDEESGISPE